MGPAVEDQQLSCLWQGPHLLSVSLSGCINYLDVNNPSTPLRVLRVSLSLTISPSLSLFLSPLPSPVFSQGQSTNLNSLTCASDTLYAGSMDGRISILSLSTSTLYTATLCTQLLYACQYVHSYCVLSVCTQLLCAVSMYTATVCCQYVHSYCVHVSMVLDSVPCHWGVESGQVDLVSGQGHTNLVCSLQPTPETLLSLGLDKNLKTTELATNEFRYSLLTSGDPHSM